MTTVINTALVLAYYFIPVALVCFIGTALFDFMRRKLSALLSSAPGTPGTAMDDEGRSREQMSANDIPSSPGRSDEPASDHRPLTDEEKRRLDKYLNDYLQELRGANRF